jgi:hypothetical protein
MSARYPTDVVAIYVAPDGRLAVLLRQTVVPLLEERDGWLAETERAAREASAALGVSSSTLLVLQWQPLADVVAVITEWQCVHEADPARRRELARVAERRLADIAFVTGVPTSPPVGRLARGVPPLYPPLADEKSSLATSWPAVFDWYRSMMSCWLGLVPVERRGLVWRSQAWIAEHLLVPERIERADRIGQVNDHVHITRRDDAAAVEHDLYPTLLRPLAPRAQADWKPWVRLVTRDLVEACVVPRLSRDEAWARRVLLVPYSIPVPGVGSKGRQDVHGRAWRASVRLWREGLRFGFAARVVAALLAGLTGGG